MAMLPFQHREFIVVNRRGLAIDHENDLEIASLDIDVAAISLGEEAPATLDVNAPEEFVGLQYEQRTVNVFEGDLRVLGGKAVHSFFLTATELDYGVFTHLSVIAADPSTYWAGPLGDNMKRISQGERSSHPTDLNMRRLIEYARKF